jgi:hypothetical protein
MKTKKYKTIGGALKSIVERMYDAQKRVKLPSYEQRVVNARNNLRDAVNHVLPQLGTRGLIGPDERPSVGLERLMDEPDQPVEKLKECARFVKNYRLPGEWTVVGASVSKAMSTSGKQIYHVQNSTAHVFVEVDHEYGFDAMDKAKVISNGISFHMQSNMGDDEAAIINTDPWLLNRLLDEQTFRERFQSKLDAIHAERRAKREAANRETRKIEKAQAERNW